MNENKDKMSLDELISKAIDTREPRFDGEAFGAKHPEAMDALASAARSSTIEGSNPVVRILKMRVTQLAAAAVLIIAAGVLVVRQGPVEPDDTRSFAVEPAKMTTAMSLRQAYLKGGLEGLGDHCDEAVDILTPASVSLGDLF